MLYINSFGRVLWEADAGAGNGDAGGQEGAGSQNTGGGNQADNSAEVVALREQIATLEREKAEALQRAQGATDAQILQARVAELEPLAASSEANEQALQAMVKSQVDSLPPALQNIITSLPGGVAEQANWLATSLPTLRQHVMPDLDANSGTSGRGGRRLAEADRTAMARAAEAGLEFADVAEYLHHKERAAQQAGLNS